MQNTEHPSAAGIANYKPPMEYRRFGKTGLRLSVITLGGMRYPHGWSKAEETPVLPDDSLQACLDCTRRALDLGINHIETAHGYGISERLYGEIWKDLDRDRSDFHLMTKGREKNYDDMMRTVETQLERLKTDHIDLYGWHGINNEESFADAMNSYKALADLRDQGVIRHIGFSSHAPLEILLKAIDTGLYEFVNLHYYYFFQRNFPAVVQAGLRDMGVFIISPNDKGGQLYRPSELLTELCAPLTPIQFNARFCLSHPQVHTMTFGIDKLEYFEEAMGIPNGGCYLSPDDLKIKHRLDRQVQTLGSSYCTECHACLPCPEGIHIPEILRLRNMWKGYDMETYGKYRYPMTVTQGEWYGGSLGNACTDCGDCLPRCPVQLPIPALLRETHEGLWSEPKR
jgi:hypothetical protein